MPEVISFEALKQRTGVTDKQLEHKCDDEDNLIKIAEHMNDYQRFASRLHVPGATVSRFEKELRLFGRPELIAVKVFREWYQNNPSTATYRVLVEVARELGDGIGAENICKICANVHVTPQAQVPYAQALSQHLEATAPLSEVDQKLIRMANCSRVTDNQLDTECIDDHLEYFGQTLDGFMKYANALCLSHADIDVIDNNTKDTKLKLSAAFKRWRVLCINNSLPATYRSLLRVAIELEDGTGAQVIFNTCKQIIPKFSSAISDECSHESPTKHSAHIQENWSTRSSKLTKQLPSNAEEIDFGSTRAPDSKQILSTKKKTEYCTWEEKDVVYQAESGTGEVNAAFGCVRRHLRWDMSRHFMLNIHFMNPEVLNELGWNCGDDHLNITTILAWAATWNTHATYYPRFSKKPADKDKAQIRVKFDSSESVRSWSMVGKSALRVTDKDEPTMVLNLHELTIPEQESMVLHEFGHALGLEHEHQRSDFWDILETKDEFGGLKFIIGRQRMESGDNRNCLPACEAVFRSKASTEAGITKSEYDPGSIMHYWFDVNWLVQTYRDKGFIETTDTLTRKEREVLLGVHKRNYRSFGQMALEPSQSDYNTLNEAYKNQHSGAQFLNSPSSTDHEPSELHAPVKQLLGRGKPSSPTTRSEPGNAVQHSEDSNKGIFQAEKGRWISFAIGVIVIAVILGVQYDKVGILGEHGGNKDDVSPVDHPQSTFTVESSGTIPFYRYWNGHDHFYTTNIGEIGTAVSGEIGTHGYKSEGIACRIHDIQVLGSVPLYRYWNEREHFYTTNAKEIRTTVPGVRGKYGYTFENIAGYCFPNEMQGHFDGDTPLFRAYHKGIGDHFYTTNLNEMNHATNSSGWAYEGIACYVGRA